MTEIVPLGKPLQAIALACPIDHLPLAAGGQGFACPNRHSFDVSAAGYVNLLPPQFKSSRDPGDSKLMVRARRRVLDDGLFDPIADAVGAVILPLARTLGNRPPLLVDAGCGEGFYTARFAALLRDALPDRQPSVLGVDISKWAIVAAAKRHKEVGWAVASNARLPVRQGSASLITSLFGFEMWPRWAELQTPGQAVVVVDAGPRHLLELREIIYPTVRVHDAPAVPVALASGYVLADSRQVVYQRAVSDPGLIDDLLEMTPHGHKSTPAAQAAVRSVPSLTLTFDAVIRVFRRQ